MDLWIAKLDRVDRGDVEKPEDAREDDLMDITILDSYVLRKETSCCPIEDYVSRSGVWKLMKDNIKTTVEVVKRHAITGIPE